jgi:cobalamin synthase
VEEARQYTAVIWVIILAVIGWLAALLQAWVLYRNLTTGTLRYSQQTFERTKQPTGYWFNVALRAAFLLVPLGIGAVATYTLLGY